MSKTKFGISVGLFSAVAFLCGYLNFISVVVIAMLALFWSDNDTVKKNSIQALILSAFFAILSGIFSALSGAYSSFAASMYEVNADVASFLSKLNIFSGINSFLSFAELVIAIILFFIALKGNVVKVPVVYPIVSKHYPE